MTTNDPETTCLGELNTLVKEFYGKNGTAVNERSEARAFISSAKGKVETLAGKIKDLQTKVGALKTGKADIAKGTELCGSLGSLVSVVNDLESRIACKMDKSDIPSNVDDQINALWKRLYELEKKYSEKSWFNTWSGFHPTLGSFSPTVVSGSLTGAEFGFGGLSMVIRAWYISFDFKSVILNGMNVRAEGLKSLAFLLKSVFSCGIYGLASAISSKNAIKAAATRLSTIEQGASRVCSAVLGKKV